MFWGCICYHGVGTLTSVDGNITTNKYIEVLDSQLWPVISKHFSSDPWIFQEDNAPCHVSKVANEWKKENNIQTLTWPPQSPDLNIIENVCRNLKGMVGKKLDQINSKGSLIHSSGLLGRVNSRVY